MSAKRVLFYVQHLLGIGHLRRAATLTRAMTAAGLDVTVASGGHEIPGLNVDRARLVQLPAIRATDVYFKVLVDQDDRPIDDDWRSERARLLLDAWRAARPHVLMFELFPFGRRQMRFELMPLLDAASTADMRPAILSSVRDILVAQQKPERNDEMLAIVERYFDRVLVHGDPGLVGFDQTFPHAKRIADKIAYTGYVVDDTGCPGGPDSPGAGEVVVSAGGGAVGLQLLQTAIAARPLSGLRDDPWRILVGVKVDEAEFQALRAEAGPGVTVERARSDFPSLLMNCKLSISQGGYNTMMEVLRAGCRAVAVPYAGGIETEQTLRARLLAARGALKVVDEAGLDPAALAAAADAAMAGPPVAAAGLDTDGAATTARLVRQSAERIAW